MATHYKTEGIVIKKENRGEADQLLTVFTKDFGKLEILGKAIRKIKSKLRAGADLFYLSEIDFIQGKTYKTLIDAVAIEKFKNLRRDSEKLEIAYKIAEVACGLIKREERDGKIRELLWDVFEKLNNYPLQAAHYPLVYYYFLWNLFSILGYQVDLYHCVKCQNKLTPTVMNFSSESNGIVCLKCSDDRIKDKILIYPETIKILRIFLKKDWVTLNKIKLEDSYKKELESISDSFFNYIKESYLI